MKILKRLLIGILIISGLLFATLTIYASTSYTVKPEMYEAINTLNLTGIDVKDENRYISYTPDNPLKNIVFVPGGLVEPESYEYIAASLAIEGYKVTIFKAYYNLSILTPNYAAKFLDEDLENIVIGHSLGGVTSSMFSSENDSVDKIILMGSYPIKDLKDKDVLFITAEHDDGMDSEKFDASLSYVDNATIYNIEEGNHAQFGWYGPQKGDGEATITTLEQQNIVINQILNFIKF